RIDLARSRDATTLRVAHCIEIFEHENALVALCRARLGRDEARHTTRCRTSCCVGAVEGSLDSVRAPLPLVRLARARGFGALRWSDPPHDPARDIGVDEIGTE